MRIGFDLPAAFPARPLEPEIKSPDAGKEAAKGQHPKPRITVSSVATVLRFSFGQLPQVLIPAEAPCRKDV